MNNPNLKLIEEFDFNEIIRISNLIHSIKKKKGLLPESGELQIFGVSELRSILEINRMENYASSADSLTIFDSLREDGQILKTRGEERIRSLFTQTVHSFFDLCFSEIRSKEIYRYQQNKKNKSDYVDRSSNSQDEEILIYINWLDIAYGFLNDLKSDIYFDFRILEFNLCRIGFPNIDSTSLLNHLIFKKMCLIELELLTLDYLLKSEKFSDETTNNKSTEKIKNIFKTEIQLLENKLQYLYLEYNDTHENQSLLNELIKERSVSKIFQEKKGCSPDLVVKFYDFTLILGEYLLKNTRKYQNRYIRDSVYLSTLECFSNSSKAYTLIPFNFLCKIQKKIGTRYFNDFINVKNLGLIIKGSAIYDMSINYCGTNLDEIFETAKNHYTAKKNNLIPKFNPKEVDIFLNGLVIWVKDNKITKEELIELTQLLADAKSK